MLLDELGIPRRVWKLAKIISLKMGRDRKVRAVELKLPNRNTVIRPINLLYPLKLQDTNETKMPEEDENVCPKSEGSTKDEQDMKTSEKITTLDDGPISSRTRSHVTVPGLECRQIGRRYYYGN